jgi:integrase/recombinase XerD
MSGDKRKGKRQVWEREIDVSDEALPSYTLEEAVDFVVKVKRSNNLKQRTIDGYIINMRYFIEWVSKKYGDLPVSEITISMLRDYVLWCANEKDFYGGHPFREENAEGRKGLSPASVNVRIRVLRTFFEVMYKEGVISRNPAANLALMRQDVDTVEPLSEDEIKRLLKAPDQRYYAQFRDYCAMVLILDGGCRLNEICSLEKNEVDFLRKLITLPAAKNKNRKSRIIPLSNQTVRLLKQLTTEAARYFESKYVFCTNYGEQLSEKTLQKSLSNYAEKAKINRPVSPHVLRHNFATMAAHSGMSIFHLMKILGHADISTTRKYVQVSDEDLTEQHKRFSPLNRVLKR